MKLEELQHFLSDPDSIKKIGTAPLPIRAGVIVVVVGIILALGYWRVINPELQTIEQLKTEEESLKKTFDQQQRKAANLGAYQKQLEEMKRSFGAMLRQLPDEIEVESLLVDLSQTSAANSLKVDYIKPSGEITKEFYAEYPIKLRVFGSYHQLAKFISDVAALPRIVTLHDISIKPINKGSAELSMDLLAKTYHYLDDSE